MSRLAKLNRRKKMLKEKQKNITLLSKYAERL